MLINICQATHTCTSFEQERHGIRDRSPQLQTVNRKVGPLPKLYCEYWLYKSQVDTPFTGCFIAQSVSAANCWLFSDRSSEGSLYQKCQRSFCQAKYEWERSRNLHNDVFASFRTEGNLLGSWTNLFPASFQKFPASFCKLSAFYENNFICPIGFVMRNFHYF